MSGPPTIYADYQATTPVDPYVRDRMTPFWNESVGNPHSGDHAVGWKARRAVDDATESVANLIGAEPNEIIFTSGATEANNLALFGLAGHASPEKKRILVSAIEHKSVLQSARELHSKQRFEIELIPVDRSGAIDLTALEATLDDDVLTVSVMAVNNEIGTIQDLPRISKLLTARNIPWHCDAAQAPCAIDLSTIADLAPLISISSHKMYGPPGIGALYIRNEIQELIAPQIHGGGQQRGLRSGTLPVPLCVGMGAAAERFAGSAAASERTELTNLRDQFVRRLEELDVTLQTNGPPTSQRHPGNTNLCFIGHDAHDILASLQPRLAASTGSACTSEFPEPSHVLEAIGLSQEQIAASIRFSFGRFTTADEIDLAAELIRNSLRALSPVPETRESLAS